MTILDNFTRESLAINVDQGINREQAAQVLDRILAERGAPQSLRANNSPEFVLKTLDRLAHEHKVTPISCPSKPTDNAHVESFNGRLHEERLNANLFLSLEGAWTKIEMWKEYNVSHP